MPLGQATGANSTPVVLPLDQLAAIGGEGSAPTGTTLNYYSAQLTTNATTAVVATTAYVALVVIAVTAAGTTSTLTVKDGQGTPLTLINAQSTAVLSAGDTIYTYVSPAKMVSGINVVTAGAAAATVSVFINYYA